MECTIRTVIRDNTDVTFKHVRLYDIGRHDLRIPFQLSLSTSNRRFRTLFRLLGSFGDFLCELYSLFGWYYLKDEPPSLVTLHFRERKIASYLYESIWSIWRFINGTNVPNNLSIAHTPVNPELTPGNKSIIFEHCYLGHSLELRTPPHGKGLLVISSLDSGAANVGINCKRGYGLLQLTYVTPGEPEPCLTSQNLGYSGPNSSKSCEFITCLAADPTSGLGITLLVCYSVGLVEIWKESVCLSDLTETLWESVAQSHIDSYVFFCSFNPSGELALVLSLGGTYMFEWSGSELTAIRLSEGSSADFWITPKTRIVAAEWLNSLEFLSLSDTRQLWLSRRCEMGHWQRMAQFNLEEVVPFNRCFTNGINRLQYHGKGILFLKMSGSWQIIQLRWTQRPVPECNILEFPMKDLTTKLKSSTLKKLHEDNESEGKLDVSDFALDHLSGLLAVISRCRNLVCVYTSGNMRISNAIEPPNPNLRAVGLKFGIQPISGVSYLAVRWVKMGAEMFDDEIEDFELDCKLSMSDESNNRCTVIYRFTNGVPKIQTWKDKSKPDILENVEDLSSLSGKATKIPTTRRWEPYSGEHIPHLSVFRPSFPDKLITGSKNTPLYDGAFAHRHGIFGSDLPKEDFRMFPSRGYNKFADPLLRDALGGINSYAGFPKNSSLNLQGAADSHVYSIKEFSRQRRGGLFDKN